MKQRSATPKDASAVILLDQNFEKVLWARRNPSLSFLGGWHAFPGGKLDAGDAEITVKNCADSDLEKFIVCAVRELFEETGVLLVRGGGKLTIGQRASLHDDLINERFSLSEIFETWGLWIDAEDFRYTGFWTTPEFSPVRFKTRFFLAVCPLKQTPFPAVSELSEVGFITPANALQKWAKSDVLISPPVLISLKELAGENLNADTHPFSGSENRILKTVSQKLLDRSETFDGKIEHIEINPRIIVFPLRTDFSPSATHTNCFIVGRKNFAVIDAASKDEPEQRKLFELVDAMIEAGCVCRAIIVSHRRAGQFGGETALQLHLKEKFDLKIPVSAHRLTAESLDGKAEIQKFIADGEVFNLEDADGTAFALTALHTPGQTRGHLCFYDAETGFLLSGDAVSGTGMVEGNRIDHLHSLERIKNLPNLKHLCGSHGAAVFDAKAMIENYISHRI